MALYLGGLWGNILWVISVLCIIWVIYDVLVKNKGLSTAMKIVWVVIVLVLSQYAVIVAIVYYLIYKR